MNRGRATSPLDADPGPVSAPDLRAAWREGAGWVGGTVIGTFSWGIATGLAMVKGGLSTWQAIGMVVVVFSGTAQLAALPLIAQGAALPAIWLTALLANLRFLIYSALVATEFRHRPLRERLMLGWLTTDTGLATYLAGQGRLGDAGAEPVRAARFAGANGLIYLGWSSGSLVGVLLAGLIPDSPRIAFVGVLAIAALLGPMLTSRVPVMVALAAGSVALAGVGWSGRMGMFAAIAAGIVAALVLTPAAAPNRPDSGGRA